MSSIFSDSDDWSLNSGDTAPFEVSSPIQPGRNRPSGGPSSPISTSYTTEDDEDDVRASEDLTANIHRDNHGIIPDSPDSPRLASSNRRRNLDALNIQRGDQRGLSQILTDRRQGQSQLQGSSSSTIIPVAGPSRTRNHNANASGSESRTLNTDRRRTRSIVEIEDDSDDDIVFTGENRNPNPPQIPVARPHWTPANADNYGNRRPSPGRFRIMMNEIDDIIAERSARHDAIVNDQEDERRRQILSPPIQEPRPRPRIGLGGAVLFTRGRPVGPPNSRPAHRQIEARRVHLEGRDNSEDEEEPVPPIYARFMDALGFRERLAGWGGPPGADGVGGLGLDAPLGMLAELGGIPRPAGLGGMGRRQEDFQAILSKVELPKYSKPTNKEYVMDFDMDSIVEKEPIELDDDGNLIKQSMNKQKKKPYLICSNCPNPLLVSSAYKTPEDRLWVLRCGHLLDQSCLNKLQTPITTKELLSIQKQPDTHLLNNEDQLPKRRKKNASRKVKKPEEKKPDEYTFYCPVEGCHKSHKSIYVDESWKPKDGEGALAAYA
ncbi:uncharacterized protein L201_005512 [Kwoniella dendrophila CBS 6074]|uniref:RING-type domain-containing protein n=1 Tax=Kwoniella dendrophila CBS 6074 TaxID=1295534 RepID=A0AAX4JZB0_9TREE